MKPGMYRCPKCNEKEGLYCYATVIIAFYLGSNGSVEHMERDEEDLSQVEIETAWCSSCTYKGPIEEFREPE